ncbi:hypothetical protein FACS189432_01650 [Bacteroidia bacterium]|nr:hypothetical protein FACS189426_01410 [Bacteroidia bacterium]GHT26699.1 hypothetical protein FACS189432_01650 [Bacteroidia bacterium]
MASAQKSVSVIDIDKQKSNKGSLKMSDIFSNIKYIPLQINAKYPIGNIHDISITSEWIFIDCRTTEGQSFLKYSLKGEFVENIGSRGQGPGEYLDGSKMAVDMTNKLMYIRANYINSVLVYDYAKNKYLRSFKVENEDRGIQLLNQNQLWFDGDYLHRYTPSYYSWRVMDKNGKVIKKQNSHYFTKDQINKKPKGGYAPNTVIWKHDNGFSYMEVQTDTIYQMDMNMNSYPRFQLNFSALQQQRGNCYLFETSKHVIIRTYNLDTKVLNDGYYDKTRQSYFSYQPETIPDKPYNFVGITNDLDGGYPFPIFTCIYFDDNQWYASLLPHKLIEYVNSNEFKKSKAVSPALKEAFRKMVNSLDEEDDPVIVIATLKK